MDILRRSDSCEEGYLASIRIIDKIIPIDGMNRIRQAMVNGHSVIVGSDFKEGQPVVYFPPGCCLNFVYLVHNNLYSIKYRAKNANHEEVERLYQSGKAEEAKSMCGMFDESGRVKCIKLKGIVSEGFVADPSTLRALLWNLKPVEDIDWGKYVGVEFDFVGIMPICWKYNAGSRPEDKELRSSGDRRMKRARKAMRREMSLHGWLLPKHFRFHYNTLKLEDCPDAIKPDDVVTVTTKMDGASGIFGNVLCKRPLYWLFETLNQFGFKFRTMSYRYIFSSRWRIKNHGFSNGNYYGKDIWTPIGEMLKPFLEPGMTVYGEIVGYYGPGEDDMIQQGYDYGCAPGKNRFMPYRVTTEKNGTVEEWDTMEVLDWTREIFLNYPELQSRILPMEVLFHGKMADLEPEVFVDDDWFKNIVSAIKSDKKRLGMELKEPLCAYGKKELDAKLKELENCKDRSEMAVLKDEAETLSDRVPPREGVVIRKDGDSVPQAWKVKTRAHMLRESRALDCNVLDMETAEAVD